MGLEIGRKLRYKAYRMFLNSPPRWEDDKIRSRHSWPFGLARQHREDGRVLYETNPKSLCINI